MQADGDQHRMARPREFDVKDAVGGAMDAFWEHGYEGASLPDLLSGMGLTRGCLACSAAAGPVSEDTDIADAVHRTLGKLRKGFEVALKASRSHARLDPPARRQMADMLTTQYVGMRVMARSQAPVAMLKRSVASPRLLIG